MQSLEAVLGRYASAMLHVSRGYALQEAPQVLAVSHGPTCSGVPADVWRERAVEGGPPETVVARTPEWAPPSRCLPAGASTGPRCETIFLPSLHPCFPYMLRYAPVALSIEAHAMSSFFWQTHVG